MHTSAVLEESALLTQHSFTAEIEAGLLQDCATISPKFLYDALGSHLFAAITFLPEYYPTNTEKSILAQYRNQIAEVVGKDGVLIDLGAGNCLKAASLFDSLKPSTYVAIDFSIEYLNEALNQLKSKHPEIAMHALGMDFSQHLTLPNSIPMQHRTFFYPGSSIGNFSAVEALQLLKKIKSQILDGGLLIGMDLMKPDDVLIDAYDDPLKVTAAFNLNILRSINNHLNSDFDVSQFKHVVTINHQENRVELYLEALDDVRVQWPNNVRTFKKGERIHTENSHKYTIESIKQLLRSAGFESIQIWTDAKKYFAVIYAK
ncbi:L-histidine N(alpha)-methyltransferase [Sapientia aquatica]|uniref:L-histidine N(Alpha)-methyltransferase n=1 Tax=Sapientia aquatica TaxID=1549640 RepID=A0A4R5W5S4_9BURK|nr:L-histidine N(alpha)-methyltransferase [Sapientia aquatica]TDK68491.1 L-histidine N(alpha)-methyltransferase [Sapientia aquatica]